MTSTGPSPNCDPVLRCIAPRHDAMLFPNLFWMALASEVPTRLATAARRTRSVREACRGRGGRPRTRPPRRAGCTDCRCRDPGLPDNVAVGGEGNVDVASVALSTGTLHRGRDDPDRLVRIFNLRQGHVEFHRDCEPRSPVGRRLTRLSIDTSPTSARSRRPTTPSALLSKPRNPPRRAAQGSYRRPRHPSPSASATARPTFRPLVRP